MTVKNERRMAAAAVFATSDAVTLSMMRRGISQPFRNRPSQKREPGKPTALELTAKLFRQQSARMADMGARIAELEKRIAENA